MDARRALAAAMAVWLGCVVAACSPPDDAGDASREAATSARRYVCKDCNVVLVSVDTLRADHVGAYGYARPTTPEIDRVAERAVVFENAIAQSSWTRPAHMSIFTGLHPREHGYLALADRLRLPEKVPTLASVLRERGYATGAFAGGMNVGKVYGFDRGFDVYRSNGKDFRDNYEEARFWLGERGGERFFLFFHGYDAHTPYSSDPADREALGLARDDLAKNLRKTCREEGGPERILPFVDSYDAAIHRADRYVGKLLGELSRLGIAERTVVIVTSDHGEEFLEHGGCFHIATLYREVLHVPLVVAAPGLAPRRVARLVPASVGIAPTVMDLLGIDEHPFPAASLLAEPGASEGAEVVSETEQSPKGGGHGHVRAVTTEEAKLVDWLGEERREYFRLPEDEAERAPLAGGGEAAATLAARLDAWATAHPPRLSSRRRPASAEKEDEASEEERERLDEELRSLGYLQ